MSQNDIIAQKAMDFVIDYETKQGRDTDPVHNKRVGYDIKSGDRKIEVKGSIVTWNKLSYQYVTENERKKATHIYLVCNINENPDLHIIDIKHARKALVPEVRYRLNISRCRENESEESKATRI
ncbi:MAG: DUF3883 domain-containing protein [Candidatus Bathyarchaeia archaeon]|jgi:hypothetical protein